MDGGSIPLGDSMITHKQAYVSEDGLHISEENFDGAVEIDKNIAPLIAECWKNDCFTFNSCEDNIPEGTIWIEFDIVGGMQFLDIITDYLLLQENNDDLFGLMNRISHEWVFDDEEKNKKLDSSSWKYAFHVNKEKHIVLYTLSIRFPREDYNAIMNILKEGT